MTMFGRQLRQRLDIPEGPREDIGVTAASWPYEYFHMCLQLSPSYLLAHRIASGEVQRGAVTLPDRFDEVERTYRIFGNVQKIFFWDWWVARGRRGFGMSADLEAIALCTVRAGETMSESDISSAMRCLGDYLKCERPLTDNPPVMLIALPVVASRRAMQDALSSLIDAAYGRGDERAASEFIELRQSDIERATVIRAWQSVVLWAVAERLQGQGRPKTKADGRAKPPTKLHNIGMRMGLGDSIINKAMRESGKRRRNEVLRDTEVRNEIARKTLELIEMGWCLTEHAARGVFPRYDCLPVDRTWLRGMREELRKVIWADLEREERRRLRDAGQLQPDENPWSRDLVFTEAEFMAIPASMDRGGETT